MVMMLVDESATGFLAGMGITGIPAYLIAIVVGLAFGALLGCFNGVLIAHGKLPPFIATLGTMQIFRSVTQQLTQHANPLGAPGLSADLQSAHRHLLHHAHPLLDRPGRDPVHRLQADHLRPPRVRGGLQHPHRPPVRHQREPGEAQHLLLTGALVAIAAIIQVSRIGSMDYASAGSGYEMDAIAAVIVGGTSMAGGKGSIVGTVLGMLIIGGDEQPADPVRRAPLPAGGLQGHHRHCGRPSAEEGSRRVTLLS